MIQANIKVPVYIDNKLEQIIRYLCNNLPENEWSGNLLYQTEGTIENKDLKIFAKYLILKDIGNKVFTSFDEDLIEILQVQNEQKLTSCKTGLIHNHNTMDTFFSPTDINTLKEKADNGTFLSLIVNNRGVYNAKISVRCQVNKEIKTKIFGEEKTFSSKIEDVLVLDCEIKNSFDDKFIISKLNELKQKRYNNIDDLFGKRYDKSLLQEKIEREIKKKENKEKTEEEKSKNENKEENELTRFVEKIIKPSCSVGQLISPTIDKRIKSYINQRKESLILEHIDDYTLSHKICDGINQSLKIQMKNSKMNAMEISNRIVFIILSYIDKINGII